MRDAALSVAIRRYLSAGPGTGRPTAEGATIVDQILEGLILRRSPELHRRLVTFHAELPDVVLSDLDSEVSRVLSGIDLTDLGGWHGDLAADVRSSVIEAVLVEWMRQRADAFGTAIGRGVAERRRQRPGRTRHR
jgi:hypothetical protein